jgi:cytochrome d ubiquinol oxidase subunit I
MAGLSAWRLLRARTDAAALRTLRTGVVGAALLTPLQAFVGDLHGLNTLEHQPAKVAAMEALWQTTKGAPLVLFAVPNEKERRNDYALEIPKLTSVILVHDRDGLVKGLDDFKPDHPPVGPVFFAFRGMVGMGVLMIVVAWFSAFLIFRKKTFPTWWLWTLSGFTFAGWFATLCGWLVTEIGRQPWLVTGILRTADAVGEVREASLGASLTLYLVTYVLMFVAYMVVLTHLAGKGAEK